jgi:hypothetical protein
VVNWIQGRDLVAVNLDSAFVLPSPAEGGDLQTIQLSAGNGTLLPTHDFYLFFPGSTVTGEAAEYVYVALRSADTLVCGPDPFGVSPLTGRAAVSPVRWPAAHHPAATRLELRNVFEVHAQLQERLDAHTHDGTTANGPVLTQSQGTNTVQVTNNTGGTLSLGDVVAYSNGQAIAVPSTGYLGLPVAVVCGPQGGPPTGAGDYSAANGTPVYVRVSGVAWARCASSVTAGTPIQTTNTKTVTGLVSPALGAIGFALTDATAYSGGFYCQVLLVNRGADILTPNGVQDVKNKSIYSPLLYSSADATARMSFPTTTANDTLVGASTPATLAGKTLTSPTINTPTITGGTQASPAITTPAITGGTQASPAITTPVVTGGTFSSPGITTPTVTGVSTYTTAAARLLSGATSLGVRDSTNTTDIAVFNNSGRIDFPSQAYVYANSSTLTHLSTGGPFNIPGTTEIIDRYNEWNSSTSVFVPVATGLYIFAFGIQLNFLSSGWGKTTFRSNAGDSIVLAQIPTPGQPMMINPTIVFKCNTGTSYWIEYSVSGSFPIDVFSSLVTIARLG